MREKRRGVLNFSFLCFVVFGENSRVRVMLERYKVNKTNICFSSENLILNMPNPQNARVNGPPRILELNALLEQLRQAQNRPTGLTTQQISMLPTRTYKPPDKSDEIDPNDDGRKHFFAFISQFFFSYFSKLFLLCIILLARRSFK